MKTIFFNGDIVTMEREGAVVEAVCEENGITTVQEGMVAGPLMKILRCAAAQKRLKLDVVGYVDLKDSHSLTEENRDCVGVYQNRFKIGGYKIFLDGSPQGRTAWMLEPYQGGEDGYRGYPTLKEGVSVYQRMSGDALKK